MSSIMRWRNGLMGRTAGSHDELDLEALARGDRVAADVLVECCRSKDLVITDRGEPDVTVDNIEVAQFVYLLLHNEKIRDVIDTVGRKGVLLLGRFTEGRIEV